MELPRFSLRFLFAATAVAAVGFAGLSRPSPVWFSCWTTASLALACCGVWRIVSGDDKQRAFWIGALLFGGSHALFVFGPTIAGATGPAPNSVGTLAIDESIARAWSADAARFPYGNSPYLSPYQSPVVLPNTWQDVNNTWELSGDGLSFANRTDLGAIKSVPTRAGIAHWMLTWALAAWGGWFALRCREHYAVDANRDESNDAIPTPKWLLWSLGGVAVATLAIVWGALFARVPWLPPAWIAAVVVTLAWTLWAHAALVAWCDLSPRRVWLGGAVVASGLWAAMVFSPGWSNGLGDYLPHSQLARHVHERLDASQQIAVMPTTSFIPASVSSLSNPGGLPGGVFIGTGGNVRFFPIINPSTVLVAAGNTGSTLIIGQSQRPGVDGTSIACGFFAALWGAWMAMRAAQGDDSQSPTRWAWRLAPWIGLAVAAVAWRQGWVIMLAATWLLATWTNAILAAIYGSGSRRQEGFAAAIVITIWTTLMFGPWFSQQVRPALLPAQAFAAIDHQLGFNGEGTATPLPTFFAALCDQLPAGGAFLKNEVWPALVTWLGLGARYWLQTPGHLLLALPLAWVAGWLATRTKKPLDVDSLAGQPPVAAAG